MNRTLLVVFCLAALGTSVQAAELKNIQVLEDMDRGEIKAYMKTVSKAMGRKCTFCHVKGEFHLDDNEHKKIAREMMKMTRKLNETFLEGKASCFMCHRGNPEPVLAP